MGGHYVERAWGEHCVSARVCVYVYVCVSVYMCNNTVSRTAHIIGTYIECREIETLPDLIYTYMIGRSATVCVQIHPTVEG